VKLRPKTSKSKSDIVLTDSCYSLETKLYSETHTKNLLTEEKKKISAELTVKKN
jgi:hypothetical protein